MRTFVVGVIASCVFYLSGYYQGLHFAETGTTLYSEFPAVSGSLRKEATFDYAYKCKEVAEKASKNITGEVFFCK